jgi:hypothetical protein
LALNRLVQVLLVKFHRKIHIQVVLLVLTQAAAALVVVVLVALLLQVMSVALVVRALM